MRLSLFLVMSIESSVLKSEVGMDSSWVVFQMSGMEMHTVVLEELLTIGEFMDGMTLFLHSDVAEQLAQCQLEIRPFSGLDQPVITVFHHLLTSMMHKPQILTLRRRAVGEEISHLISQLRADMNSHLSTTKTAPMKVFSIENLVWS